MNRRLLRSIAIGICAIVLTPIALMSSGCQSEEEGVATSSPATSSNLDPLSPIQDPARTSALDDLPVYPDTTKISDRLIEETATRSYRCNAKEVTEDQVRQHLHDALIAGGWTQGEDERILSNVRYAYSKDGRRLTIAVFKDDMGYSCYTLFHRMEAAAE
jgi:hypothetical protein